MNSRPSLVNGLALGVGLLVTLVIAEGALAMLFARETFADRREDQYWVDLAARQSPHRDASTHGDAILDEFLGWRMRPGRSAEGVTHNALGFRGATLPREQASGPRILAIGDSFTYGLGVKDGETFSAQLERITGVETINAGVNAYGVDQAVLMWERHGRPLEPDVVVLGYYVDDFYRNLLAIRDGPKPHFRRDPESGQFVLRSTAVARQRMLDLQSRGWRLDDLRVVEAMTWFGRRSLAKLGYVEDETMVRGAELSHYLLARLDASVRATGARLVVVFIGDRFGSAAHQWIEDEVMKSCANLTITCINLAESMRQAGRDPYFGDDHHFSVLGHRFAAEQIAQALPLER